MQKAIKKTLVALGLSLMAAQVSGVSASEIEVVVKSDPNDPSHTLAVSKKAEQGRVEEGIIVGKIVDVSPSGYLSGKTVTLESPSGNKTTLAVHESTVFSQFQNLVKKKDQSFGVFYYETHSMLGDLTSEGNLSYMGGLYNPFTAESYNLYGYDRELTSVLPKKAFKKTASFKVYQDKPVQDNSVAIAYAHQFKGQITMVRHHNGLFGDYATCQATLVDSDKVEHYFTTKTAPVCQYLLDSARSRDEVIIKAEANAVLSEKYSSATIVSVQPASVSVDADPVGHDKKDITVKVTSEEKPPYSLPWAGLQIAAGVTKGMFSNVCNVHNTGIDVAKTTYKLGKSAVVTPVLVTKKQVENAGAKLIGKASTDTPVVNNDKKVDPPKPAVQEQKKDNKKKAAPTPAAKKPSVNKRPQKRRHK